MLRPSFRPVTCDFTMHVTLPTCMPPCPSAD